MNQPFRGTGVALVTPFKEHRVDYDALEKIIEHTIQGGVDYIVALGTTGEAITQSREECRAVFDFTIEKVDKRVPIVAGLFGSNYTERLVEGIKNYNLDGFAAIMSSSPAYNKPPQEGIYQHFMAVEEVSPLPIIIYNVPGRTSSNITAETTLRLAHASDKFVAVKEASGDIGQAMQIIKNRPSNFAVISGDDPLTLPMIACGGDGVISVIANAFPAEFSDMVRAAMSGDFQKARMLNDLLLDVHPWLYVDGNPTGVKAALEMIGLCQKEVRLPLVPASKQTMEGLWEEVKKIIRSPHLV
ncbi:MAG: 4-hydroxy-tetrahydrodipicolinate synthase [Bacteroidetes bacterium]|jgi:4-hydroxy-tetrahydrodipicolinate synthase|nr:4-hydroxy-tetrahydrodipicolinate synthase [Bacteroidota bacterium]MDF1864900.1 4-hydroxy-tetrahydrodipicolinate synthase [Saprospiraceae bacterium]